MNKRERLEIEKRARTALSRLMSCDAVSKRLSVGSTGPLHEFDIYAEGIVIGGVSTGTYNTSGGNPNTASRDRACAELLWLSLWPGDESRVHVLTDRLLAEWLSTRFNRAPFSRRIDIYHYDWELDLISHVRGIGAETKTHTVEAFN